VRMRKEVFEQEDVGIQKNKGYRHQRAVRTHRVVPDPRASSNSH
jgi:hypothetical protein